MCFRSSKSGLTVAIALSRIGDASSTSLTSLILPRLMRETSSRSSIKPGQVLHLPLDDIHRPVDMLLLSDPESSR